MVAPTTTAVVAKNSFEASLSKFLSLPSDWPGLGQLMEFCQTMGPATALLLLGGGVVFLLWGQSASKILTSLNCTFLGAWLGGIIGNQVDAIIPGMLVGGFLGGVASVPLAKHALSVIAAIVGFVFGAALWRSFPLEPNYAWSGGVSGLIFFTMLSLLTPKWTHILTTGLQGAAMCILGILGLILQYGGVGSSVSDAMKTGYLLPVAILVPAIIGWVFQNYSAATTPAPAKK